MRSLSAAETDQKPTEKKVKLYPAFEKAIEGLAKESEELVKEGETLYKNERNSFNEEQNESAANLIEFLRNNRQYWRMAFKTAKLIPIRLPFPLSLLKKKDEDEEINFNTSTDRKKQEKIVTTLARDFQKYWTTNVGKIPTGKLKFGDPVLTKVIGKLYKNIQDYYKRTFQKELSNEEIVPLIEAVMDQIRMVQIGQENILQILQKIKEPKATASIRSLSRFAAESDWTKLRDRANAMGKVIDANLVPLYRGLTEAWASEKYRKNLTMLRNFFMGKEKGSGLRYHVKDVLVPNIDILTNRIYGKEAPEQREENDTIVQENDDKMLTKMNEKLEELILLANAKNTKDMEEATRQIKELRDREEDPEKRKIIEEEIFPEVSKIAKDFGAFDESDFNLLISEEGSGESGEIEKSIEELTIELQKTEETLDKIIEEAVNSLPEEPEGQVQSAGIRSISLYAEGEGAESKGERVLSIFEKLNQKVKSLTDKIKNWFSKKVPEEEKIIDDEGRPISPEQRTQLHQALESIFKQYKDKILSAILPLVTDTVKEKVTDKAKADPIVQKFSTELPKAFDRQLESYQKNLEFLFGDNESEGNATVQDKFKKDCDKIIQDTFQKIVVEPLTKAKIRFFQRRLFANPIPTDNLKAKEGEDFKLDEDKLNKILVDSFKATIDKNKEEVEGLLQNQKSGK